MKTILVSVLTLLTLSWLIVSVMAVQHNMYILTTFSIVVFLFCCILLSALVQKKDL